MKPAEDLQPFVLVIFGGGGDLAWRKLVPALYSLYLDRGLPESFAILGLDRMEMSDDALRERWRDGVDKFSRKAPANDPDWGGLRCPDWLCAGRFHRRGSVWPAGRTAR